MTRRLARHIEGSGCPLCTFLPPFALADLAKATDDPAVRSAAIDTLNVSAHVKTLRATFALQNAGMLLAAAPSYAVAIYNAGGQEQTPGILVAKDTQPAGDPAAVEAYQSVEAVRQFYQQVFGRNSLDGSGLSIDSSVHYGTSYSNAMWTGQQMIYGDGDGVTYNRFTVDLDVIGHELTHGVVQYSCNLVYSNQPGALNEHLADVFGTVVKQWSLKQSTTDPATTWLIGEHIFLQQPNAVRSMKAPGSAYRIKVASNPDQYVSDQQVANMANLYAGAQDFGGVHTNSGIPNHAFYLASVAIGGHSWETLGRVWFNVMTGGKLSAQATFGQFAALTVSQAEDDLDAAASQAVEKAWHTVGVLP
jgi:Zn-dependent metalloprotease